MDLSSEEQAIIKRYRQLSLAQRQAVMVSENSFIEWIKETAIWIWERFTQIAVHEVVQGLYDFLLTIIFDQ